MHSDSDVGNVFQSLVLEERFSHLLIFSPDS